MVVFGSQGSHSSATSPVCHRLKSSQGPSLASRGGPKSQYQIYVTLKCLKSLAFCRNNGRILENHGHKNKIYAKSSTRNTLRFIWFISPNQPIIWDIFEKTCHYMSIVHGPDLDSQSKSSFAIQGNL